MIVYSCTRALAGTTWCGYLWCLSPRMVRSYCHYYARIFCLERQKKQHVGGDTGRQVHAIKTLRNKKIACIDDITI